MKEGDLKIRQFKNKTHRLKEKDYCKQKEKINKLEEKYLKQNLEVTFKDQLELNY